MRVAVVGAGVIGFSTALALRRCGHTVEVFEAAEAGRGSSWAGAGILYPLLPWHYDAVVNQWCLRGIALQESWIESLREASGIDAEHRVTGMRVVGGFGSEAWGWLRRHGQRCERNGADLHLPEVAQVRNPRLLDALRVACARSGVALHQGLGVVRPWVTQGAAKGVCWSSERRAADAVVWCAGAWSGLIEGVSPPAIFPVRGQMLALRAPEVASQIVYQDGRYLVPRRDGVVLLGSTMERSGFVNATTPQAAAGLLAWARHIHPALGADRVIRHWAGLRPGSRLNHPFVGRHAAVDGLWFNTGHFRYGLTMAPACADWLAVAMSEGGAHLPAGAASLAPSGE